MKSEDILKILQDVERKNLSAAAALERLKHLPFEDIDFAKVDHHRSLRQGFAEVIFGKGKTPTQVAEIVRTMIKRKDSRHNVLVTRADAKMFAAVKRISRAATFHQLSGVITIERNSDITGKGTILIVSAGTSDIPVAEEALLTARMMGNTVEHLYDVGVAGIHRLLDRHKMLTSARVVICIAGMEGALPSVVGGLGGRAGNRCAHQHRLRRQLRWRRRAARHAELLRLQRHRGQHRQRFRRRLRRLLHQPPLTKMFVIPTGESASLSRFVAEGSRQNCSRPQLRTSTPPLAKPS